jgi:hypothetical protein
MKSWDHDRDKSCCIEKLRREGRLAVLALHPRPQTLCNKRGVEERSKNKTVMLTCSEQIIYSKDT